MRPAERAVDADDAVLELERLLPANGGVDGGLYVAAIVGVDVSLHPVPFGFVGVGDELATFETPHLRPVRAHPVDDVGRRGSQRSKTLVVFFKGAADVGVHRLRMPDASHKGVSAVLTRDVSVL